MLKNLGLSLLLMIVTNVGFSCPQTNPIDITESLIEQLANFPRDSSNANQVTQLIGSACACLPTGNAPSETWICQWKGNLASNQIQNTINISFESGMISQIIWVNTNGDFITKN